MLGEAARRLRPLTDRPLWEAELLLQRVLGLDRREFLALDRQSDVEEGTAASFQELIERRCRYEPLQYLLGSVPFCEIEVEVGPGVLIPRPETEVLVERLSHWMTSEAPTTGGRMVDVGVGTGVILLTLLHRFPGWQGWGIDPSADAIALSRRNCRALGSQRACLVRARHLGVLAPHSVDVVVSNPPYIPTSELAGLQPEVRDYEPRLALDGGEDGLDHVRVLLAQGREVLKPGGLLALELATDQPDIVVRLAESVGFERKESFTDLAGRPRGVVLQLPSRAGR